MAPRPVRAGHEDLRAMRHCTRVVAMGVACCLRCARVVARALSLWSALISVGSSEHCPSKDYM
eukprot:3234673-Prymnesium_polylepis.1